MMHGAVFPPLPRFLAVWAQASQQWSLQTIDLGQVSVPKWWPPRELMMIDIPWGQATSVLPPTVSHSQPLSPQETLQDTQVCLAEVPMGSLLCAVSQCTWNLVCALWEWSLCFPQSCGAPAFKPHWTTKPNGLRVPPPSARSSGWGALHGAQNSHSCERTSAI